MTYSKLNGKLTLLALLAAGVGLAGGCTSGPTARSSSARNATAKTSPAIATATAAASAQINAATAQVIATERGFAKTMTDRNLKAFVGFLSPDAIFFSGNVVEHGAAEIASQWAPYFQGSRAPFSWQPDHVEITPDGKLALSTGPILQQGKIVGRFNSVWRLEAPNTWRIVFDKGEAVCAGPPPA